MQKSTAHNLLRITLSLPGLVAALAALGVALAAPGGAAERLGLAALAGGAALAAAFLRRPTASAAAQPQPSVDALPDAAPEVLWTADADGRMRWLNARWSEHVLAPAEPGEWLQAVHPDDMQSVAGAFSSAAPGRATLELELRLRSRQPAGGFRTFLARARRTADGGWCGTFVDVDERHGREAALREADRRKDEFLAILGHELRNPLAAIRNALSITSQRDATAEQSGAARRVVERQIAHMVRLIDGLLDVNRAVGGHVALRTRPLDVAEALRSAVEATRAAAHERRQPLSVEVPGEPLLALGDRERLEQVFAALLGNASKYSGPGAPLRVSLAREAERAVIRFEDHGIGIEPRDLPRVFEPFVQLDPARAREDGGLGIGLTLVRHLVELHGGRVDAWSEGHGRGSVFTVSLPALPRAEAPAAAEARPLYRARPRGEGRRILVVDDNADSAQSLATLLSIQGHEVCTAGDGLEGLRAAERFRPDVVLLDLGMPRMDGYEAARRLRSGPRGDSLLLLALTGWSHDDDRTRSREAGFDEHLVKPVDPDLLGRVLQRLPPAAQREAARPL